MRRILRRICMKGFPACKSVPSKPALTHSAMYITQCPHCDTRFRVLPEHLEVAGGQVRCGRCRTVFNARERLEQEPAASAPPAPVTAREKAVPETVGSMAAAVATAGTPAPRVAPQPEMRTDPVPAEDDAPPATEAQRLAAAMRQMQASGHWTETSLRESDRELAPADEPDGLSGEDFSLDLPDFSTGVTATPVSGMAAEQPAAAPDASPAVASEAEEQGDVAPETTDDPVTSFRSSATPEAAEAGEAFDQSEENRPEPVAVTPEPTPDADFASLLAGLTGQPAGSPAGQPADDKPATDDSLPRFSALADDDDEDVAVSLSGDHRRREPQLNAGPEETPLGTVAATEAADALFAGLRTSDGPAPETIEPLPVPRDEAAPGKPRTLLWAGLSLAASLALAGQLAYLYRAEIAREVPGTRAPLEAVCSLMGCSVPLPQDAAMLRTEWSEMRYVPDQPQLVQLAATVQNHARYNMVWPSMQLVLKDAKDHVLAKKVFAPAEWLPADTAKTAVFPAGGKVKLQMQIALTDIRSQGYSISWFYP